MTNYQRISGNWIDIDQFAGRENAYSGAHTMVPTERIATYIGTGGHTFTLMAASAARGALQTIKNAGTGTLTVDATGSGQIFDEILVNTLSLLPGDSIDLGSNGTRWALL